MQAPPELLIKSTNLSLVLAERPILKDIDLRVHRGEIVTLIGPNGAGKSCLLKCLLKLVEPTYGQVFHADSLRIGYTPQKVHFEPTLPLTVEQFLKLGQKADIDIEQVLAEVGIDYAKLGHQWMYRLSGGELQRVMLARALSLKPDLLVLDEPAQGVDIAGQSELYRLLARIRNERHCGILVVSHDLSLVMADTDQVLCLNQHVCCSGRPGAVARDPSFQKLFGKEAQGLALYAHEHDHRHNVEGEMTNQGDHDV